MADRLLQITAELWVCVCVYVWTRERISVCACIRAEVCEWCLSVKDDYVILLNGQSRSHHHTIKQKADWITGKHKRTKFQNISTTHQLNTLLAKCPQALHFLCLHGLAQHMYTIYCTKTRMTTLSLWGIHALHSTNGAVSSTTFSQQHVGLPNWNTRHQLALCSQT